MDKQELICAGLALVIILVIALIIKPIVTGQSIHTGIPSSIPASTPPIITPGSTLVNVSNISTRIPTTILTAKPIPTVTWNKNVTSVAFVDPSKYGITLNQTLPGGTRFDTIPVNTNMTIIATISSDTVKSGTTNIIYIPFPYWELVYTVSPSGELKPVSIVLTPTQGTGSSRSGVSGSFSTAQPLFTIQVMDGDDPNRIVRTITPPGGIDLDLWTGVKKLVMENSQLKSNQKKSIDESLKAVDPRPWTEKFYEGERNYFFIISTKSLDSYNIQIRVPSRYFNNS